MIDQLAVSEPFQAVVAAHAAGGFLEVRDMMRFEPPAVRALFDEGLIEQQQRLIGRAEQTVIVPSAMAITRTARASQGEACVAADSWKPAALNYLDDAYPTGASWREMMVELDLPGGQILVKGIERGLVRPAFRKFPEAKRGRKPKLRRSTRDGNWMMTPAWRIRKLRMALRDARARGTNPFDDGGDLTHRAMRRQFEFGRANDPDTRLRRWTEDEDNLLRENYPRGGVNACAALLPHRSDGAIMVHASVLKLTGMGRSRRRRYETSPEIDAAIRRLYRAITGKGQVKAFAAQLGYPRYWVSQRATFLGLKLPRTKEPAWSPAEDVLLAEHAHKSLTVIQRILRRAGHSRTETAIKVRIKRKAMETSDPDHLTASTLAKIVGMDAKVVIGWIDRGYLKAGKRGTKRKARQGGDQWWIHKNDIRAMIAAAPNLVDIRKVDQMPFLELIAAGETPKRRRSKAA